MNKSRGRGRPRGGSPARGQILDAARTLFFASGYEAVTLRAIANAAGVDVALISYYFNSKRGLFTAVMQLQVNPPDVLLGSLAGELAHLPERILAGMLAIWDDPDRSGALRAVYRGAGSDPDLSRLLRELLGRELIGPIAEHLGGPDATARASCIVSQVAGLIFLRYVLQVEPLASMPAQAVVTTAAAGMRGLVLPAQKVPIR